MSIKINIFISKTILSILSLGLLLISTNIKAYGLKISQPNKIPGLDPLYYFYIHTGIKIQEQPALVFIKKNTLLPPYDYLLTQPLMTVGIAHYYQRTPKVRVPLYSYRGPYHTYSRGIVMIIDNNKVRDDALTADCHGESKIIELGMIKINFAALPQVVIEGVLQEETPFGALLVKNNIQIQGRNKRFFNIKCDKVFGKYFQCSPEQILYGRTHTIIRSDTQEWVAQVVEILK